MHAVVAVNILFLDFGKDLFHNAVFNIDHYILVSGYFAVGLGFDEIKCLFAHIRKRVKKSVVGIDEFVHKPRLPYAADNFSVIASAVTEAVRPFLVKKIIRRIKISYPVEEHYRGIGVFLFAGIEIGVIKAV
ncbi:hypothetical protein SDC9_181615 [bioreactor metagenome]|uniref:Uncharacterized protein n=1 Tax=bioreactor metagenome TaxID=1076179 RepID=A0A645H6Z2_9ZZZZ